MMKRRDFLSATAASGVMLSSPRIVLAAGKLLPTHVPDQPFLNWFNVDGVVMRRVMGELVAHGADAADLYFEHNRGNSITMEDRIISSARSWIEQGVGLRVVIGDQTGYAYTEDLSLEAMLEAARTAAAIARGGKAVPPRHFNVSRAGDMYRIAMPWSAVKVDDKLALVRKLEKLARQQDSAVKKVTINWSDYEQQVVMATLDGRIVADYRPMTRLWCTVTAEKHGVQQSTSANLSGRYGMDHYTDERLQALAKKAVDNTLVLFDARRPPAGEMPVLLAAGASGILLHEAIGHGMEADFNRKGTSIYSDMLNKKVANPQVTIVDQGNLPHERGALNYDDEGNAARRNLLVDKGILRSYLHDGISARHYKVPPSGSGRRESYRHAPMPRMTCTYMEDGPHSREEMIASMKKGIVAETYTNGQVSIGAGDFTFYIKNGWLVENGRITAPIKDCNIIGNGPQVLKDISMVGNDSHMDTGGWTCGKNGQSVPVSLGMPSVLVSKLTVGGEHAG
ncbi:TldD/PmbA family protein [Thiolapillus brandeum]|uniref:Modulator of DNA gyrase TldD n=1 Tax=Thiolapillus brandeum TaxID=1076588 RepID=A0A7U6GGC6_9GAMM|nr:metallopeptidase TldD-related protein [Thiolapillus brandeum]BAO43122.1 modulator of DNA gyrase TldD [Thiolapillus brandeum]